jgi:putative DNA primase/helicase
VFTQAAARYFGNPRDGDQYGTLLAGYWSLIATRVATPDDAQELLERYDWTEHREQLECDEGIPVLGALMSARIRLEGGIEASVNDLIRTVCGYPVHDLDLSRSKAIRFLEAYGMKVRDDRLLVSNTSDQLRQLMGSTRYGVDLRGALLRVEGAHRHDNKVVKFNGTIAKCVSLPLALSPGLD